MKNRERFGYKVHKFLDNHTTVRSFLLAINKPIFSIGHFFVTYKNIIESQAMKSRLLYYGKDVNMLTPLKISQPEKVTIGNNVYFGQDIFIASEGGVHFGNNIDISDHLIIYTWEHGFKTDWLPFDDSKIAKPVIVKDNVWIGRRVTIKGGITLGEGSVVGMGSVVTHDVPDLAIVAGNPARIIGYRDKEIYQKAKEQGHFFDMIEGCQRIIQDVY